MKYRARLRAFFVRASLVVLGVNVVPNVRAQSPSAADANSLVTVLSGALLIDGTGRPPVEKSYIVVRGDRILAVGKSADGFVPPAGAKMIDVTGRTIMPGLISAHSHLGLIDGAKEASPANYTRENVARQLDRYESYGVTAVMSLGLNKDVLYDWRNEQHQGKLPGADIFTADRGIGVPNGVPPFPLPGDQVYRPATPAEARTDVDQMAARHPDLIKLWLDDAFGTLPKMDPQIYGGVIEETHAAVDEAHRHSLRVAAHEYYLEDAKSLVAAGVDILAHSVRDKPVDRALIDAMKAHSVAYIPTLQLDESQYIFYEHPPWMDEVVFTLAVDPQLLSKWLTPAEAAQHLASTSTYRSRAAHREALANVKTLFDAGILVAMGTDSGAMPTRIAGWAEHRELQLLVAAGLTPMQAIVCATANSARVIGQEADRGTLTAGKRADFLVLESNPLERISDTLHMATIWHGGKEIVPLPKRPVLDTDAP